MGRDGRGDWQIFWHAVHTRRGRTKRLTTKRPGTNSSSSVTSSPEVRAAVRQQRARPLLDDPEAWLHTQLTTISAKTDLAKTIRYVLSRIKRLRPYLEYGVLELDNNSAERAMRPISLGRKNYLFMGSEGGGKAAAIAYTLIETAK